MHLHQDPVLVMLRRWSTGERTWIFWPAKDCRLCLCLNSSFFSSLILPGKSKSSRSIVDISLPSNSAINYFDLGVVSTRKMFPDPVVWGYYDRITNGNGMNRVRSEHGGSRRCARLQNARHIYCYVISPANQILAI